MTDTRPVTRIDPGGHMYLSDSPFTVGLATASIGILTLGLVSAPPPIVDATFARTEVHAVQLAAVNSAQISAALVSAVKPPGPLHTAAATSPSASSVVQPTRTSAATTTATTAQLVEGIVSNVAIGTLFVVASPLWYLAAPLTFGFLYFLGGISLSGAGLPKIALGWLAAPFTAALTGFQNAAGLFQQLISPPATASSTNPVSHAAATVAGPRSGRRAAAETSPGIASTVTSKPPTAAAVGAKRALPAAGVGRARTTTPTVAAIHTTDKTPARAAASSRNRSGRN